MAKWNLFNNHLFSDILFFFLVFRFVGVPERVRGDTFIVLFVFPNRLYCPISWTTRRAWRTIQTQCHSHPHPMSPIAAIWRVAAFVCLGFWFCFVLFRLWQMWFPHPLVEGENMSRISWITGFCCSPTVIFIFYLKLSNGRGGGGMSFYTGNHSLRPIAVGYQ